MFAGKGDKVDLLVNGHDSLTRAIVTLIISEV